MFLCNIANDISGEDLEVVEHPVKTTHRSYNPEKWTKAEEFIPGGNWKSRSE